MLLVLHGTTGCWLRDAGILNSQLGHTTIFFSAGYLGLLTPQSCIKNNMLMYLTVKNQLLLLFFKLQIMFTPELNPY